jgi:amino acid adenylation domain-containing protein/non-ribosomal peptide synthase protein (TIGR01720 family)
MTEPQAILTGDGDDGADAMFRLSPQQAALCQSHPGDMPCLSLVVRLHGLPDQTALAARWQACVGRLEILRTALRTPAWSRLPLQDVADHVEAALRVEHLPEDALGARLAELDGRMVDPKHVPGVQACLILTPSAARLHLSGGAQVVDGDSLVSLAQHLLMDDPDSAPLQYPDIAEWAAGLADDAEAAAGLTFWQQRLADLRDVPLPALAAARPAGRGWCEVTAPWPARWTATPPTDAEAIALTLILAARWAAAGKATVAVRSHGRDVEDLAGAVGPLARWLPLTADRGLEATFADWRSSAQTLWTATQNWQHLIEAGIGDATVPEIAFGLDLSEHRGDGEIEHLDPEPSAPRVILRMDRRRARFSVMVDRAAHDPMQAQRLARMAATLAEAAFAGAAQSVGTLNWLDDETRGDLIAMGTGPALTPAPERVLDRIARQAAERPEAIAVVQGGVPVTYSALWRRAAAVASTLPRGCGEDERPVAVRLARGPDALVAMLGAWRAGRSYTVCDPGLPATRLDEMLRVADPVAQVARCPEATPETGTEAGPQGVAPDLAPHPDDIAYLLFTSGSTGTPKAVAVTHATLAASTAVRTQHYQDDPRCFLVVSPLGFDSSVAGLYWTLATGGAVVLPTEAEAQDAAALADLIQRHAVSHTLMLPGLYDAVLDAARPGNLDSLELVIVAGEHCPASIVARHRARLPQTRLENEYGPTEATVWCTAARLDRGPGDKVTIGSAIPGTCVRVLDPMLRPVPPGVPGEIFIGGAGLARGYLGRPSETALRFVPDPFSDQAGARLYRVGDQGMLTADGRILYQGRIDTQVKIRGHRVELEEVEAHLRTDPRVRAAAVAVRGGRLVAYLVLQGEGAMPPDLQGALAAGLPDWMAPQGWVVLDALPLGATGKLDRAALPDPDQIHIVRETTRAPRDALEHAVVAIWAELLNIEALGIDDNFFQLGGDSLMALRLSTRMRQLGVDASPRLLLKHPTIARLLEMSPRLDPASLRSDLQVPAAPEGAVPLTALQQWLVDRAGGMPARYNQTLRVETDQALNLIALERAFHDVVDRHDALRLRFEQTPQGWRQRAGPARIAPPLLFDLARVPDAARAAIEATAWERLHGALDPENGWNARLAVIRRGGDSGDLLLAVVHHMCIDAASWQVVMEDMDRAYRAALAAEAPHWSGPAGSFTAWIAATLATPPDGAAPAMAERVGLPVDHPGGSNREGDVACLSVSLDASRTDLLGRRAPGAFGSGLDALLVAALAETLADWSGQSRLHIDRERHGRDPDRTGAPADGIVGWLTEIEPILFEVPPLTTDAERATRLAALIKQVDGAAPAGGQSGANSEVLFNFLGVTDRSNAGAALFRLAPGPIGRPRDPALPRRCLLEIDAEVTGGQLKLDWHYAASLHDRATIARLAEDHLGRLGAVAETLTGGKEHA